MLPFFWDSVYNHCHCQRYTTRKFPQGFKLDSLFTRFTILFEPHNFPHNTPWHSTDVWLKFLFMFWVTFKQSNLPLAVILYSSLAHIHDKWFAFFTKQASSLQIYISISIHMTLLLIRQTAELPNSLTLIITWLWAFLT